MSSTSVRNTRQEDQMYCHVLSIRHCAQQQYFKACGLSLHVGNVFILPRGTACAQFCPILHVISDT